MKKLVYIFFVCGILSTSSEIQSQYTQEWVRRVSDTSTTLGRSGLSIKHDSFGYLYVLSGRGNDFGFIKYDQNGNVVLIATNWPGGYDYGGGQYFDVTPNGNVYITGFVAINLYDWIYTVKFNSSGIFQWGKFFNFDSNDDASNILVDNAENVIIGGGAGTGNSGYALLLKYNSNGDTLWTKHFNYGQYNAVLNNIVIDNSNNIYATGYVNLNLRPSKSLIMKFDPSGNINWTSIYSADTTQAHQTFGINLDLNGNIYVALIASVNFSLFNDYLLKLDNNGDILWSRLFRGIVSGNGRNSDYPRGPVISSDGNSIYFSTMSANGLGGGSYSIATVKYSSAGDSQWVKVYSGGGIPGTANEVHEIKLDRNNNIYICGLGYYSNTGDDFIVVKYSSIGSQLWNSNYGGLGSNGYDASNDLFIDTSLNVYATGISKSQNYGNVSVTIKYSQTVGISPYNNEIPNQYSLAQNYPNPFNPVTIINYQIPKESEVKLVVYNLLGEEVKILVDRKQEPGHYSVAFNLENFPSGVYFYKLTAGDFTETKKMILIK